MLAPRLAEALHQGAAGGIQIDDPRLRLLGRQRLDDVGEERQILGNVARVYAHRHPAEPPVLGQPLGQRQQQREGQVVNAVVAQILKDVERRALARPRPPANHRNPNHGFGSCGASGRGAMAAWCSAALVSAASSACR